MRFALMRGAAIYIQVKHLLLDLGEDLGLVRTNNVMQCKESLADHMTLYANDL